MGPQLGTILRRRNMSVRTLSTLAGVSVSVIYKALKGVERISLQVKVAIARALGLGVEDIHWGQPDGEDRKPIGQTGTNQKRRTPPERLCNGCDLYYHARLEECPEC